MPEEIKGYQPDDTNNDEQLMYEGSLDTSIIIQEQTLAYRYMLDGLNEQVKRNMITPDERDQRIIHTLIEKDIRLQNLFQEARIDRLTGLPNRMEFNEQMDSLIKNGTPFALLLGDIDHFKTFNDTYGHLAGDLVLMRMSSILKDQVREAPIILPGGIAEVDRRYNGNETDVLGRLGGEEWGAILKNVENLETAVSIAERIRNGFEKEQFPIQDKLGNKRLVDVRTSIGVGIYDGSGRLPFMSKIDTKLYQAKESGRNRVAV